jgi:hypothetical protein
MSQKHRRPDQNGINHKNLKRSLKKPPPNNKESRTQSAINVKKYPPTWAEMPAICKKATKFPPVADLAGTPNPK